MTLWTSFLSAVTGTDLAAEQARSDAADAQLEELNRQALNSGHWDQATYDQAQADLHSDSSQYGINVADQVSSEFNAGLREGLGNVTGTVHDTLSGTISAIFKAIPPMAWVLGLVALFVWMGGMTWLRGSLARK